MMIVLHKNWRTKSWNSIICSQWIAPVSSPSAWLTEQMKIKCVKLTKKIDLGTECSCGAQKGRGHIRPIKLQFIVQQNLVLEADILAWHQKIKTWLTVTKQFSKKTINIINVYWQECAIHMVLLLDFIVPMAYFFKNWFVIIVPISALKWGVGWNVL